MRGPGAAIATLIFALAIAAGAFALPKDAELGRMAASGPVTLSSSRAGVALLHGENIMPGDSVTGLITLNNKGDKPGSLALMLSGLRDRPACTAAASRASCACASTTSRPAPRRSRPPSRAPLRCRSPTSAAVRPAPTR